MNLPGGWELVLVVLVIMVLFGAKRLPEASRSLGRSMRIFKSEVSEMKNDGKSAASSDTVRGEAVREDAPRTDNPSGTTGTTGSNTTGTTGTSGR